MRPAQRTEDVLNSQRQVWMIGGFLAVAVAAVGGTILYGKYYVRTRVLESKFETRVDRKLASAIGNIQKKEKKG